jgi:hypothetical protein
MEEKCEPPSWNVVLNSNGKIGDENEMLSTVHWIRADPFHQGCHHNKFPMSKYAHTIPNVRVRAGRASLLAIAVVSPCDANL